MTLTNLILSIRYKDAPLYSPIGIIMQIGTKFTPRQYII